ncbi:unnamed protein product [Didymodactylos carnosus]|uniref:Uncharacterized protein n=1 Tax=Didymodactylos carnosus TaxID=1234261 RepID=A0A813XVC2_9BILA|nr:unnamed protein product [Didymodactylos carnosus]CAF1182446.1 unnamed protein product [Didymodactylos carnosus]CAF3663677.1 unnamed protein product [Didymodactylos carnosus]CAF3993689.1 unnamed protein product [Didymodactylos carnosus]
MLVVNPTCELLNHSFPSHRFQLSSNCPLTMSLLKFAERIGGTIDQEFLSNCIIDKKSASFIKQLKPVPAFSDYFQRQTLPLDTQHVYIDPELGYSTRSHHIGHPSEFLTFGSQTFEQLGAAKYSSNYLPTRKQNKRYNKRSSIRLPPPPEKPDLIIELPSVKIPINMEAYFQDEKFKFSL